MALLKSFNDSCGNEYAQSYWRTVQINISAAQQSINLVFYGYKDGPSFAAGKQSLPGAVKSYAITGTEFAQIAASVPVGSTLYDVLAHASEDYAKNKLDTPSGQVDADGKPVLVSFFDGSQQV